MASLLQLPADPKTTHDTAGLSGFPAVDEFAPANDPVYAPVGGKIVYVHTIPWDAKKRVGGTTAYLQGDNGKTYFLTHLTGSVPEGRVKAGQKIGQVSPVPDGWWASHVHEGVHQGIYDPGIRSTSAVSAAVPALAMAPIGTPIPTPPTPQPLPPPQPQPTGAPQPGLSAETQALLLSLLSRPARQPVPPPQLVGLTHPTTAPTMAAPPVRLAAPAPLMLRGSPLVV